MSSQEQATSPATLLSQLRQHLGLDTEYTVDHDDGFTWWPNGTPIRFRWAGPRAEAVAIPTSRISFEIDAIEGIDVSEEQEAAALSFLTKTFNLFSSAVEDGTLRFRGTAHLLEGGTMAPVARLFNQAFFASHLIATKTSDIMPLLAPKNRGLFRRGGAQLVTREHPANGVRRNASDIPASSVQSLLDAGAVTTAIDRTPDVPSAARAIQALGIGLVASNVTNDEHAGATSFNVVIETRDATSLLEIQLDQTHPSLGLGMLAVLRIRFPEGHLHGSSEHLAATWNRLEWEQGEPIDLVGAWTPSAAGADVAYSAFYPNAAHNRDLARTVALEGVRRVQWVFQHHGYDTPFTPTGPYGRALLGTPEPTGMRS